MKDDSLDSASIIQVKGQFRLSLATNIMYGVTLPELVTAFQQLLRAQGYHFDGELEFVYDNPHTGGSVEEFLAED